jgi:hypothetical protein
MLQCERGTLLDPLQDSFKGRASVKGQNLQLRSAPQVSTIALPHQDADCISLRRDTVR